MKSNLIHSLFKLASKARLLIFCNELNISHLRDRSKKTSFRIKWNASKGAQADEREVNEEQLERRRFESWL